MVLGKCISLGLFKTIKIISNIKYQFCIAMGYYKNIVCHEALKTYYLLLERTYHKVCLIAKITNLEQQDLLLSLSFNI